MIEIAIGTIKNLAIFRTVSSQAIAHNHRQIPFLGGIKEKALCGGN